MSYLAIDAGQTSIKVAISADGKTLTKLTFPGIRTDLPLLPQLAEVTIKAANETGINPNTLAAGVSGLTNLESDATKLLSLTASVGITKVILAHDSITAFLGTLGDEHGVVVASGTGVVTFGVGPTSTARVDGWGWIMGDAGSGFWIGKQALTAVMRAHDKRGQQTELTERVQNHFPNLEDAYIEIQSNPERVQVVASFAKDVSELAQTDPIAKEISDLAATELVDSVTTAWQRVSQPNLTPKIAVTGSVFKNSRLHETFLEKLQTKIAKFELIDNEGDGLTGAIALTGLNDEHPLLQAASVAVNS
ncbi:MAG: N-acetylglucosamine kinase [Micrococcales bacterium]